MKNEQVRILEYNEHRDYQYIINSCEKEGWVSMYRVKKEEYRMSLAASATLVAYVGDHYSGYIRYLTDKIFTTFVCELFVAPEYRRQGIGSELIEHAMKTYPSCRIDLISDNDEFYISNRFSVLGNGMRRR